jgi:hypothetical protein
MVTYMSWANFSLSLIIVFYSAYLYDKGRKVNKGMMLVNVIAGLWGVFAYGLFIFDALVYDVLSKEAIREYCIKPMVFVLFCTILGWTIRSDWRHDR